MRSFSYRHDRSPALRFNMTPMIDVTFLLLTFFMLASHFASAEKIDIDLPHPDDSQAVDQRFKDKVIINMLYNAEDEAPKLTFGPLTVSSIVELAERLDTLARVNPKVQVILRADRRLSYGHVREVMEIIAASNLTKLQVVTKMD